MKRTQTRAILANTEPTSPSSSALNTSASELYHPEGRNKSILPGDPDEDEVTFILGENEKLLKGGGVREARDAAGTSGLEKRISDGRDAATLEVAEGRCDVYLPMSE